MLIVAAAAIFDSNNRVLVQKRPLTTSMPGLWEFPGGKLETGESPEHGLARELQEELGIFLLPQDIEPLTFASAPLSDRHLILLLYTVRQWRGEPAPLHATELKWVEAEQLSNLQMPPADYPLLAAVMAQATSR